MENRGNAFFDKKNMQRLFEIFNIFSAFPCERKEKLLLIY